MESFSCAYFSLQSYGVSSDLDEMEVADSVKLYMYEAPLTP